MCDMTEERVINIYSTHYNGFENLSNMRNGPVSVRNPISPELPFWFRTVEHAFQYYKAGFAGDPSTQLSISREENAFTARQLGQKICRLNMEAWDKVNGVIMTNLMWLAFVQNEHSRQLLLLTGNAVLTHFRPAGGSLGKWGQLFPNILMNIRDHLHTAGLVPPCA
jgi:ribA/ribD-fused uncharacterized protein